MSRHVPHSNAKDLGAFLLPALAPRRRNRKKTARFQVFENEMAAGHEGGRQPLDQFLSGILGEIHQDVAAENDVVPVRSPDVPAIFGKIDGMEGNSGKDACVELEFRPYALCSR